MIIKVSKPKLAAAVIAIAMVIPTTAWAVHSWPDVDDERFYAEAVVWAKANGMTTGCNGGTAFCPEDPVTRGENITFAKRYDDLVVQPALATIDELQARVAALEVLLAGVWRDGTDNLTFPRDVTALGDLQASSGNMYADNIFEVTANNGVSVDGVDVGRLLAGVWRDGTDNLTFPRDVTAVGDVQASSGNMYADNIFEVTPDNGVSVDGVLHKDGLVP